MPVYNEKGTIREILKKTEDCNLGDIEKEIIVVDDCSRDGTRDILKEIKTHKVFFHDVNKGKGAAIQTALIHATGDIVVCQDADLEYEPNDLKKMVELFKNPEIKVVYGSRFLNMGEVKAMYTHYMGNKFLTFMTNLLFGAKITDMETCYKMVRRDILKDIPLESKRFEIEPEITAKLLKRKLKIQEVPISYNYRSFEEGKKITLFDGVRALYYLLKYRFKN